MSRMAITGASGMLGSHLAAWFLERGWEVHALLRRFGPVERRLLTEVASVDRWGNSFAHPELFSKLPGLLGHLVGQRLCQCFVVVGVHNN